jgi:hypothetical protein
MKRFLIALTLLAAPAWADDAQTVVEMFTSKFCPNCPSAEHKMMGIANNDKSLLVIFEHVDYWDRADMKDPYGLHEATERQYDYSNSKDISDRPGQVFTPMPIINGQWVASPPLWLSWDDKLEKAHKAGPLPKLKIEKLGGGGLQIAVPKGIDVKDTEIAVMGVEQVEGSEVRRLMRIEHVDGGKASITVPSALTPKTDEVVVLLQQAGPKAVLAMGWLR